MAKIFNPLALLLAAHGALAGLTVDVEDTDSIAAAAALVAEDLMTYYPGNDPGNPVGILGDPSDGNYSWWTGGLLWNALLDYRNRTGVTKYDQDISKGLIAQTGQNDNYLPANWSLYVGNDDESTWAMSALFAEEIGFQEPSSGTPQWLTLAKNVFNDQSSDDRRVDDDCEDALRWQIYAFNNGYNYINSATNVQYFNLAARLAHLTGNETYQDAASDSYDILTKLDLLTDDYDLYDGVHADECGSDDDVNKLQSSYTSALLLEGSAVMYNQTGDDDWKERVDGLVTRTLKLFFQDGVAFEASCEKQNTCNSDMIFFKAILHRGLSSAIQVAPHTSSKILPALKSSAKAAAAQCTGGDNGRLCGFHWSTGKFDGVTGAGQQLGVLAALTSILPVGYQAATSGGSSNSTGSGSSNSTDGSDSNQTGDSTSDDTPDESLGARASVSLGALMGSLLMGSFFI
ncbi:glycoside hydrolase family 76 protein [Hypoxylon sp. CI-4A]|nr:glycoside hydrolase family 76 protein [Hypoxylon sp. CI-4A]